MSVLIKPKNTILVSRAGTWDLQEDYLIANPERGIFSLADGFGGPGAGEIASKVACESVQKFLEREVGDLEATMPFVLRKYFSLSGNILFNAVTFANQEIRKFNKTRHVHEKGGASFVAGFVDGDRLSLAQVGTCEVWLFRDGKKVNLVLPRSYGRLMNPFLEDVPEEWSAPLMALGMTEDVEPEINEFKLIPGDWVLFQTDGVPSKARQYLEEAQLSCVTQDTGQTVDELQRYFDQLQMNGNGSILLAIF